MSCTEWNCFCRRTHRENDSLESDSKTREVACRVLLYVSGSGYKDYFFKEKKHQTRAYASDLWSLWGGLMVNENGGEEDYM